MVEKTLQSIRQGGIYDHLGFGFHRYSTDSQWLVPHFEKMLYDQALLSVAYIEAYQATGKEAYAQTAREVFDYVLRDMQDREGGFYSAEDADSEGVEGKFYLWTYEEIEKILSDTEMDLAVKVFNVNPDGNFSSEIDGGKTGGNILHHTKSTADMAPDLNISIAELQRRTESIRGKLFEYRKQRVHPYKDDKILTDWNGLMIAALASHTNLVVLELHYNQISDISPLVENSGLSGNLQLASNNLDLSEGSEDLKNIRILEERGVEVIY